MEYNKNKLITDDGNNLVSQSLQEGQKVNFDSIIITDTPLPNDRQLSAMTIDNFKNARKHPITTLKKGNNSVQPEAKLDNNGLTADYPIHAIGLLAHVGESNSELFGITQNSEGTPAIITKQSQTPYFITYDMAITVTNPDNYTATITPAGYVDQTTFDEAVEHIQTSIKNIDLSDATKKANEYTDEQIKSINDSGSAINKNIAQAKTDANAYTDSVKDGLQHGIDTTNQRVDTVHDQLGGDIASAKSELNGQIGELSDKSLKFIKSVDGSDNYDNLTDSGFYRIQATPPKNGPSSIWSILVVYRRDDLAYQQVLDQYGGSYSRMLNPGGWKNDWERFVSQNDTDKLNDKINDLSDKSIKIEDRIYNSSDLNTYTHTAMYTCNGCNPLNSPLGHDSGNTMWGNLSVYASNNVLTQIFMSTTTSQILVRHKTNYYWTNWQTVATTDDTAALSTRLDKAQDQLGADIRDAEQRANTHADEKIKFFDSLDQVNSTTAPEGTLAIVKE